MCSTPLPHLDRSSPDCNVNAEVTVGDETKTLAEFVVPKVASKLLARTACMLGGWSESLLKIKLGPTLCGPSVRRLYFKVDF